jgi:hypothetical protein
LVLDSHMLSVSVPASLAASDPAHKGLFSPASGSSSRVRIGRLMTNGALQLGTLAFARNDLRGLAYELWLEGSRDEWHLDVMEIPMPQAPPAPAAAPPPSGSAPPSGAAALAAAAPPPSPPAPGGKLALSKQRAAGPAPSLVPALIPTSRDSGRLVIRWGDVDATADLRFTQEQRLSLGGDGGRPNQPVNRRHDEDTSAASRILIMTQRNETAFAAGGSKLSVSFPRTLGKGQRSGTGGAGVTANTGLDVEGIDFKRLMSTPDGSVVQLTEAAVPRLVTERAVKVGRAQLRPGNQTPGHPGAYALWLKRAGRGWRLVFNDEPDTWGSQYDKKHDVAEIDLAHTEGGDATRPFSVALVPTAPSKGRLVISWGPHDWATDWTY